VIVMRGSVVLHRRKETPQNKRVEYGQLQISGF